MRRLAANPQCVQDLPSKLPIDEESNYHTPSKGLAHMRKSLHFFVQYKGYMTMMVITVLGILMPLYMASSVTQSLVLVLSEALPETIYQPRYVRFIVADDDHQNVPKVNRLDLNMELYPSKRRVYISVQDRKRRSAVRDNSADYEEGLADEFETDECKAQYDWQKASYPTCNSIHEMDMLGSLQYGGKNRDHGDTNLKFLDHGYFRDVWLMGLNNRFVLKTLRYEQDFDERNYDRHRRDVAAMQHLTKSKMIANVYGFCANSGIYDFADGGNMADVIWPSKGRINATYLQRLHMATQAAMGIAALHNADREGVASIAHTDIAARQFVSVRGIYQLNDFNRLRFVRWNVTSNQPCPHYVVENAGKSRSPEEYSHDWQTEKVDIYSYGNLVYSLLTGFRAFRDISTGEAQKNVMKGLRPRIPREIKESTNSILKDMMKIMFKCLKQDPKERATARQVESFLLQSLHRHDPTALERWGLAKDYASSKNSVAIGGL
jgi:serine/threonine protein kinase